MRTHTHLNNLKLGYVHHDGRNLAAVVALEGLGYRRPERAAGAVVHLFFGSEGGGVIGQQTCLVKQHLALSIATQSVGFNQQRMASGGARRDE